MSYIRSYREKIAVKYSGSVSYPASQNGGSVSYSGTEYEDVTVNINVDTSPFDDSIAGCNTSVKYLTGAVVATEAAHIVSIDTNARKIGSTIIEGFFKTIRSEISQQIAELSQKIEAHLMHLRELGKSCKSKKSQMERDYYRISSRYGKIFEDLNNELSNRIHELNKPAFSFKKECDNHAFRSSGNDLVSTVAVFGSEAGELQTRLSASVTKKRALDTINQAHLFLWKQKKLENTVNQCMLNESLTARIYAPVCYLETLNQHSQIDKSVYTSSVIPSECSGELIDGFGKQEWSLIQNGKDSIKRYFNAEVNSSVIDNSLHSSRVNEMIVKIFDVNSIKVSKF